MNTFELKTPSKKWIKDRIENIITSYKGKTFSNSHDALYFLEKNMEMLANASIDETLNVNYETFKKIDLKNTTKCQKCGCVFDYFLAKNFNNTKQTSTAECPACKYEYELKQ